MLLIPLLAIVARAGPGWKHQDFVREKIARIPNTTRVLVLSDDQHRLNNTRTLTLQIVRAFAERYPREKVCVTFETTPKADEAWTRFAADGNYERAFGALGDRLEAPGLSRADARRIYIEPSGFVAEGLRSLGNVRAFGGDVDYTDEKIFRPLLENMKPPRKMSDDEFARLFVDARNKAMAAKANSLLKSGTCTRLVMSMGSAHARAFVGKNRTFPDYTGGPIAGVVERLDGAFAGKPYVIGLGADPERVCPRECDLVSSPVQVNDLNLTTPGNYFEAPDVLPDASKASEAGR